MQAAGVARGFFAVAILAGAVHSRHAFAPDAVPAVAIFPRSIALGSSGALEVQVEMPRRAGKPILHALAGTVGDPVLQDGLWVARYRPPAEVTSPGWDVVVAETPGGAAGAATVELIAKASLPVTVTRTGAAVTVEVGGRTFGPVQAGKDQTVSVDVEIPPGADEVAVTAVAPGVDAMHTVESLAVPPLARVFVEALGAKDPKASKSGKAAAVRVVVLDKKGALSRVAPNLSLAGHGTVGALVEIGPGIWETSVSGDDGPVTLTARGQGSRAKATLKFPSAAGHPVSTATVAPAATPTPVAVATVAATLAIPPAPSCESLGAAPGEITTAKLLRTRIEEASRRPDLVARRDGLIGLLCRFPDEHAITLQLTATWILLGDDRSAIDVVQALLADESETHDEHRALGLSYRASAELRLGRIAEAVDDARAAETVMPGLYSATYTLGEAYFLQKDFPNATAALLSAYRTAPEFASQVDHSMLAELLEAKGDAAEACAHRFAAARLDANEAAGWKSAAAAAESAKLWPRAHEAWLVLAAASLPGLAATGDALAGAARAAAAAPKDAEIGFVQAALDAERSKNAPKAVFLLDKVIKEHPRNSAARYHLARLLFISGNYKRATSEVGSLLNDMPRWAPALILSGDIARATGDKTKAAANYRDAMSLVPPAPMSAIAHWRLDELDGK